MGGVVSMIKRGSAIQNPPAPSKVSNPVVFGILGAAKIGPMGLILPAQSHPEVFVKAVASRDPARAIAYGKKNNIPTVYSGPTSYQDLVLDEEINAVYIALPLAFHFEWALKCLAAGKHVLLEKPTTCTPGDTKRLFDYAAEKQLVLMEAAHYRFHPANQRAKEIVESGELGKVKSISAEMSIPKGYFIEKDDIRLHHELGGGAMQDMGYYPLSVSRFITSSNPTEVISADMTKCVTDDKVDTATHTVLAFPNDVTAELTCEMYLPPYLGFIPQLPRISLNIKCEGGELVMNNFPGPHYYHTLVVKPKKGSKRTETVYHFPNLGKDWWTTYRYQLEAFVDQIKGRTPQFWIPANDSVDQATWLEKIYEKGGLGPRPASNFVLA